MYNHIMNPEKKNPKIPKITETYKDNKMESLKNLDDVTVKEYLFRNIVENKSLDIFLSDMEKFGFSNEQINEFSSILADGEHMLNRVLAYPYELRQRMLPFFKQTIDKGQYDLKFMYDKLVERSVSHGAKIAYHCGSQLVQPRIGKDNSGNKVEEWCIDGTERDHRDDDLPMAYYSFDYKHLYRTKNPKYLYLIESLPKHRTDGSEWGRAPALSVIDYIKIEDVDREVEEQYQDYIKKETKQEKAA